MTVSWKTAVSLRATTTDSGFLIFYPLRQVFLGSLQANAYTSELTMWFQK